MSTISDSKDTDRKKGAINRRRFIASSAGAGAGLMALAAGGENISRWLAPGSAHAAAEPSASESNKSRVVVARKKTESASGW